MSKKVEKRNAKRTRRSFTEEFKKEAVALLLDGHSASSVAERLGLSSPNVLYRWKQAQLEESGPIASTLEARVHELEVELQRVIRERDILKKRVGHFRPQRVTDIYAAVPGIAQSSSAQTSVVCEVLGVSRSAYYAWRERIPSERESRDTRLAQQIQAIFWNHRRRYGARRIAEELADQGEICSPRKVAQLLSLQGLRAIQPKSFVPKTTQSRHRLGYSPNLLLEAPEPSSLNDLWVGDISYVPLTDGRFCYLAMLMDRYSRRIVGWNVDQSMTEELVIPALQAAIRDRQPAPMMIHHTDRGGQYAGGRYRAILRRAGSRQSLSRADNCYDNAFMESCFGTLKTELEMTDYKHHRIARRMIGEYIAYYNLNRKHSALGYLTPHQFELQE